MTRIIAGEFGGRRLDVPAHGTRPSTDRVREAMFSKLESWNVVQGAVVLDLYAGSGALAFEAISRGAVQATLVEKANSAANVIRKNIAALGLKDHAEVVIGDALRTLRRFEEEQRAFNLVFADPPYDIPLADVQAFLQALTPLLEDEAVVVFEWSTRAPAFEWPEQFVPELTKSYGETNVHYATWRE